MWPSDFRKKKPYTADELRAASCERDAEKILKSRGSGEIMHLAPPDEKSMVLGAVHPPGGGVITDWHSTGSSGTMAEFTTK